MFIQTQEQYIYIQVQNASKSITTNTKYMIIKIYIVH